LLLELILYLLQPVLVDTISREDKSWLKTTSRKLIFISHN
jgi:hypothetical protein